MSNDYHLLSTMVNGGGANRVNVPASGLIEKDKQTVQINPYGGDYYSYGQNSGEHQFVDYGGLFQDMTNAPLPSAQTPIAQQSSVPQTPGQAVTGTVGTQSFGQSDPVVEHFQLGKYLAGQNVQPPKAAQQPAKKTSGAAAQSADVEKLMNILNQKTSSPGAPTYLDLLARDPETVMPTSIEARRDPFYGMAGWNQGGN